MKADKVTFSNSDGTVTNKISIDPTTGTLNAVDGNFSGVVKASTLYSEAYNIGDNETSITIGTHDDGKIYTHYLRQGGSNNYDIYLPLEDNHFTNRLKYPAKSFRLDCLCDDDDNVRFFGELLGTFTKISQVKTTHPKDNIMSIEALDWLLPRNGVFVVMCEKK